MIKHIAIVAYWEWDFLQEQQVYLDNYGDGEILEFHHISKAQDIPSGIIFGDYVLSDIASDIMSYNELKSIQESIKLTTDENL